GAHSEIPRPPMRSSDTIIPGHHETPSGVAHIASAANGRTRSNRRAAAPAYASAPATAPHIMTIPRSAAPWKLAHGTNTTGIHLYRRVATSHAVSPTNPRLMACGLRLHHLRAPGIA